jgi:SnoaL-like domain
MKPCPELKQLILSNYEKESRGTILEVVQNCYSRQEGTTLVGTDPKEWFEGYQAIFDFYAQAEGSKLNIKVQAIKAYSEGNVGWTVDRVTLALPDGTEVPVRHTKIFENENGAWRIVHNHVSVAIANEEVGQG